MVLDQDNHEISRRSEVFEDSKVVFYFTYNVILSIFSMLSDYVIP